MIMQKVHISYNSRIGDSVNIFTNSLIIYTNPIRLKVRFENFKTLHLKSILKNILRHKQRKEVTS